MNRVFRLILPAAAVAVLAPGALAQFGAQMSPQAMAKMQAWRKFMDNHKNYQRLQTTMRALYEMEKDPKLKLNKAQAKNVLAVLNKWGSKPTLTDDQAGLANKQLCTGLTKDQLLKIATMPQFGRGGRGGGMGGPGGPRPGGGPGGPGAGNGNRPRFDPANMPDPQEYNPLNPGSNPRMRARGGNNQFATRMKQNREEFINALKATK